MIRDVLFVIYLTHIDQSHSISEKSHSLEMVIDISMVLSPLSRDQLQFRSSVGDLKIPEQIRCGFLR